MIGLNSNGWAYLDDYPVESTGASNNVFFYIEGNYQQIELIVDHRLDMQRPRRQRRLP